jgi:assimilatory nitrate reductase catalytic subunit
MAAGSTHPESLDEFVRSVLGLPADTPLLAYRDRASGQFRAAAFEGPRLAGAVFLAPDPVGVSRQLVCELLNRKFDDATARWQVIAGRAGTEQPDKGSIICACHSVGVNEISTAIASGCSTVDAIGLATRAGTNCGSCRAELRTLLNGKFQLAAE